MARLSLLVLLCLACSFFYCTAPTPSGVEQGFASPIASQSGGELDLGALKARAQNAFRDDGAGIVAHGDTFVARIEDDAVRLETRSEQERAMWKIGTSSIVRGHARSASPQKAEVTPDGAVRRVHDAVEERWENHGEALEQTWHFGAPPRGEGDLVIHVEATGLAYAGRTAAGLHFGDGGLGFRYGNATWVDAAGRRTAVIVGWNDGRIALTVPRAVLEGATYPAVLDPVISPEIAVDQSIPVSASVQGGSTQVAATESGFLVAWQSAETLLWAEVRAVRVDFAGNVLDPLPIVVWRGPAGGALAVAGDGPDFFVVWSACESGASPCDVKGVRVRGSDGALLDPFTIAKADRVATLAIARRGTEYFVGWTTATEVRGSVVQNGAVIAGGANGRVYATLPAFSGLPLVAAAGASNFMVAWGHQGLRIHPADGAPLDPAPVAFAGIDTGYGSSPITSVAFDGANYYAVWTKSSRLLASRIRASDGQLLDPDDTFNEISGSIVVVEGANAGHTPDVVFDGTWLLVSSAFSSGVSTIRVDPATGRRSDAPGTPVSYPPSGTTSLRFDIAIHDGRGFVVSDDHGGAFTITDGVLSTVAAPKAFAKKGHSSANPIVASNGTDYLVVWEDWRAWSTAWAERDLYGARIRSSDGAVLDPAGFLIASGSVSSPALASDGTDYVLTYVSWSNTVTVRKIRSTDAFVEAPLTVGTGKFTAVTCGGTSCIVAWTKPTIDYYLDLGIEAFRRLDSASMTFVDASARTLASSSKDGALGPVSVAVDNPADPTRKTFLLAWVDGDVLRASRVRATSGAAVDADDGHIALGKAVGPTRLAVTSNGTDFLVAWYDNRNVGLPDQGRGFYATRIDALNGTVLDGVQPGFTGIRVARVGLEANYGGGLGAPSLAHTGLSYWLTWGAAVDPGSVTNIYSLRGMRMTSSLSPLDPETGAVLVSNTTQPSHQARYGPNLAPRSNGETLLAYSRYDEAPTALGDRVKARILVDDGLITTLPDAGPDASDASSEGGVSGEGGAGGEAGVIDAGGSDDAAAAPADASSDSGGSTAPDTPAPLPPGAAVPDEDPADDPGLAGATGEGGCGCRVTPASTGSSWLLLPSLVTIAFALRRRRSREAIAMAASSGAKDWRTSAEAAPH